MFKTLMLAAVVAGTAWGAEPGPAKLKLPAVLASHMVLQRDMPVPIWGNAAPGTSVTVAFAGQTKSTKADDKGVWRLKLDPMTASDESRTMTIAVSPADTNQPPVALEDVLVGEVWVGSGQSNMQTPVSTYVKGDPVLATNAAATYPRLRVMRSVGSRWEVASPSSLRSFSALLFSFAVPLQKTLNVPMGLMVGAAGGTPSGYWLSEQAYRGDAACQAAVAKALEGYTEEKAALIQTAYTNALATWKQAAEAAKAAGKPEPRKPAAPVKPGSCQGVVGNLYERWIRPYQPYAIRGVLWDQGEAGTAIRNVDQYTLMGALINGWRQEWGQGAFPFIYVQKPSGGGCAWDAADPVTCKAEKFSPLPATVPTNGGYRELHTRIMNYSNTAMVIASDLGSGIHPLCKSGYGARAARVALGMVYGQPVEIYGPLYRSHAVEAGKIRVRFAHVGQGLAASPADKLQGFAVAGADKQFQWAEAVIDGDAVVVSSEKVTAPVAVRYAWSQTHPWANLFNKDGLPALPFRTDAW